MTNIAKLMSKKKPVVDLSEVKRIAQKAIDLQKGIDEVEEILAAQKSELDQIKKNLIPEALVAAGISSLDLEDGSSVKLHDFVSGNLPKGGEERENAIKHLEEIGGDGMIKDTMTVLFEKSQHNQAGEICESLREKGFNVDFQSGVHTGSLHAFAKKKMKDGTNISMEKLGLFSGRTVKIKLPKKED